MIIIRRQRHHTCATSTAPHIKAFHIVDLVAHVGLQHDLAIHSRTVDDIRCLDAADTHVDARCHVEPTLEQQHVATRQEISIRHIEFV